MFCKFCVLKSCSVSLSWSDCEGGFAERPEDHVQKLICWPGHQNRPECGAAYYYISEGEVSWTQVLTWVLYANSRSEEHIESTVENTLHLLLFIVVSLVKSLWLLENLVFWLKTQHGLLTLWMGPLTLCMGKILFTDTEGSKCLRSHKLK